MRFQNEWPWSLWDMRGAKSQKSILKLRLILFLWIKWNWSFWIRPVDMNAVWKVIIDHQSFLPIQQNNSCYMRINFSCNTFLCQSLHRFSYSQPHNHGLFVHSRDGILEIYQFGSTFRIIFGIFANNPEFNFGLSLLHQMNVREMEKHIFLLIFSPFCIKIIDEVQILD